MNHIYILNYIFLRLGDIELSDEHRAHLSVLADWIIIHHAEELLSIE
jgi:hypothetical protein